MKKLTEREKMIRESTEREKRKKRLIAMSFQAKIDRAVRIIKMREKKAGGEDVLHNKRALFNSGRVRGAKVG